VSECVCWLVESGAMKLKSYSQKRRILQTHDLYRTKHSAPGPCYGRRKAGERQLRSVEGEGKKKQS
jgi:hypothetical protein